LHYFHSLSANGLHCRLRSCQSPLFWLLALFTFSFHPSKYSGQGEQDWPATCWTTRSAKLSSTQLPPSLAKLFRKLAVLGVVLSLKVCAVTLSTQPLASNQQSSSNHYWIYTNRRRVIL
jgi:hypothetical protein